jgi:hypothetical protein
MWGMHQMAANLAAQTPQIVKEVNVILGQKVPQLGGFRKKFYKEDPSYVFGAYGNAIFGFYLK